MAVVYWTAVWDRLVGDAAEINVDSVSYTHLSRPAAVLRGGENGLVAEEMLWGFPRFEGNGLIINARAETALERRTFRESVRRRRCVIPARGFYEWNAVREKFSYERRGGAVLFMAGFYQMYQGRNRFVILTTEANASVRDVHDRMPLVLEPEELESWVLDDLAAEGILRRVPALLKMCIRDSCRILSGPHGGDGGRIL